MNGKICDFIPRDFYDTTKSGHDLSEISQEQVEAITVRSHRTISAMWTKMDPKVADFIPGSLCKIFTILLTL